MPHSALPPMLGFVPSGTNGQRAEFIVGNSSAGWEGFGFGPGGRPDIAEKLTFYLANVPAPPQQPYLIGTISMTATGLYALAIPNPNFPSNLTLELTEVATCETDKDGNTTEMRRVALLSQAYAPAP
jgi:hypothetical protein